MGVETCDPAEYLSKHGASLLGADQLPSFVNQFKVPEGEQLACSTNSDILPRLVGDVHALNLIDLNKYALGEYKSQIPMRNEKEVLPARTCCCSN